MKKIISTLIVSAVAFFGFSANAQTSKAGNGLISLTSYISPDIETVTGSATSILSNKLNQVINANGLGSSSLSRFIITANVNVLTKDIITSAPPMTALTLDVTIYIGDGFDGNKFASHTLTVKGVGINENKALMEAFKSIKPNDPALQAFVTNGKSKIIEYYNSRCGQILKEAKLLEAQNKFEEAIFKLTAVPDASGDCYNKAIEAVVPIYQKLINRDCQLKLQEATGIWNANQNMDAATTVGEILNTIDPSAACYGEVKAFSAKVGKRVLELDSREWKYKVDSTIGLQRDLIQAYRDVGVAYGNGQPKTVVYNTRGWW